MAMNPSWAIWPWIIEMRLSRLSTSHASRSESRRKGCREEDREEEHRQEVDDQEDRGAQEGQLVNAYQPGSTNAAHTSSGPTSTTITL